MNSKSKYTRISIILLLFLLLISGTLSSCVPSELQSILGGIPEESGELVEPQLDQETGLDEQESFILIEEIVVILLFIASLVGIVARRLRVPYTLGLVVIGLLITLLPQVDINIQPTLIFALLIPPIIFEGAFHLNINDLRRDIVPILTFAVPGVILTMAVVGALVSWGTGIPIIYTLVFGAIVAA
ncbi:MAG: cation:proton antiporter, partial [Chloroflexota bacterium]